MSLSRNCSKQIAQSSSTSPVGPTMEKLPREIEVKRKRGSRSIITDASVTVDGGGVVLERRR